MTLPLAAIAAVGVLCAIWLTIFFRQSSQGRAAANFVIALCPMAFLLVVAPLVVSLAKLVRGFHEIARQSPGGLRAVAPYCLDVSKSLISGGAALLLVTACAAILELFATPPVVDEPAVATPPVRERSFGWVMAAGTVLVIPAAAYAYFAESIPVSVMRAAQSVALGNASDLTRTSRMLALQLMSALPAGVALSVLLLVAGVLNLFLARRCPRRILPALSWLVIAASAALGLWAAFAGNADIRTFMAMFQ